MAVRLLEFVGGGWRGLLVTGVVMGLCGSTTAQAPVPNSWDGQTAPENLRLMTQTLNGFGWNLGARELQSDPGKNVFISPLSVGAVLQMAALGAEGETRDQILHLVGWDGVQSEELVKAVRLNREILDRAREGNRSLSIPLPRLRKKNVPSVEWTMANGLWSGSASFDSTFQNRCEDGFGAKVGKLDGRAINAWVSRVTRTRIPTIVEPSIDSGQMSLILTNAVYFKGTWSEPFDGKMTVPRPFRQSDGSEVVVPMMENRGYWLYAQTDVGQAALLPYGAEKRIGMVVILPPREMGLGRLAGHLSRPGAWKRLMAGLKSADGIIRLPKFRMEDSRSLNASLQALGMTRAFTPEAQFAPMVRPSSPGNSGQQAVPDFFVEKVVHKSFVEIDEQGTEAAAATALVARPISADTTPRPPPFQLFLDRPFVMALVERETGMILFSGIIQRP